MILLVEDHDGVRGAIATLLRSEGHDVIAASSVAAALAVLKTPELRLIITDIQMPDMSGMDLLHHVRRTLPVALPVIILTAHFNEADEILARRLGVEHYLLKHRLNWEYFPEIVKGALETQ